MADETQEETPQDFPLTQEENNTPKPAVEDNGERTPELPADHEDPKRLDAANHTANQTTDEGNKNEVQGKLAVPYVKVMKRGQTLWTDEDGKIHKELNDAEPNAPIADAKVPDYLILHNKVLEGADPIKAELEFKPQEKGVEDGSLKDAELHPRTMGVAEAEALKNDRRNG